MKKILVFGIIISTALITGCYYHGPCLKGNGNLLSEVRDISGFTGVSNTASFEVYVNQSDEFRVEVITDENLLPMIETYVAGRTLIIRTKDNACYRSNSPVTVYVTLPELELLELNGSGRVFADKSETEIFECANSGSGYMGIDSVFAGELALANSGSGSINLSGAYVEKVTLIQSGSGDIDAGFIFESKEVTIRHSSSGKVWTTLLAGDRVDATLSGSGRIYLAGDVTESNYTLSSSGTIDALENEAFDARATNTGSGKLLVWATDFLEATITGSGDIIYRGDPTVNYRITGSGSIRRY